MLTATAILLVIGCCRIGADIPSDAGPPATDAAADGSTSAPAPTVALSGAPGVLGAPPSETVPAPVGEAQNGPPGREIAGAAHILIAYKGAQLAPKEVTRSKAEARKRAEDVLAKLQTEKGSFAELAKQYSDDPSKVAGGAIGNFERYAMPAAFSDATFALEVGAISGIVETPRGFHIIQRTR